MMFINLSNHPSDKWSIKQTECAKAYGELVDMPFPKIDPYGTDEYINGLVQEYFEKIVAYDTCVVMVQGEYLFTYRLVCKLKEAGIKVLAGCSERRTIEYVDENGFTDRRSEFEFVDFKEY